MNKIDVQTGQSSYSIIIGAGILNQTGEKLKALGLTDKAVIVTNPVVNKLYGEIVRQSLIDAGFQPTVLEIPDGEKYKTLASAGNSTHSWPPAAPKGQPRCWRWAAA